MNEATGEPLKRALVRITELRARDRVGAPNARTSVIQTTLTDAAGHFQFDFIPEGRYTYTVRKPQFTSNSNAQVLVAPSEGIRIPMSPLGVITGRIVDQNGFPLRAVDIYALSTHIVDGLRETKQDRNVSTDDRGMYRLWNLAPGKYFIKASGFAVQTVSYVGDTLPATLGESVPTVYFPGAQTRDSAIPLEIRPGSEAVADLTIEVVRAFTIRGKLANMAGRTPVRFELQQNNDSWPVRVTINKDTGKFEVAAVVPGSYVLRATQDESVAEISITMPAANLEGVAMSLESPVDIQVTQRFDGEPPASVPKSRVGAPLAYCMPSLHSAKGDTFGRDLKTISQVPPGRYHFLFQCLSVYARSAMYGSQDLLLNPEVVVAPSAITPIEIVASYGGGTINGLIENVKAALPWVVVSSQFGGDPIAHPATGGQFSIPNLAPGKYTVYGFSDLSEIEFRNPAFNATLTGGITVVVEDGKEQKITIPGVVR